MIQLKGINKTYFNGAPLHVLKGIDLDIEKGEMVSIMGASGSGKSTLLNILGILDTYDTGTYLLNGQLIQNLSESRAAELRNRMIGFIFQSFNLISFKNAVENVALPLYYQGVSRKKRNAMALEYLDRLGLKDWAHHMPNEMSGGQKQRVAIAGILAMHPKCIVLDEPTAMLDPNGRKDVIRAARALNDVENVTIILITHYMEEVIYADRVFVMDEGKVVMQGTPREIFSQVERLKHLRLDVPQVTLLAYELQKSGLKLPDGILTAQELTEELNKLCTGSKTGASDNRQMPVK